MKLYCYKFYDKGEYIIDVGHIAAKDNESARWKLGRELRKRRTYGWTDYHSYRFFEVNDIEGYDVKLVERDESIEKN